MSVVSTSFRAQSVSIARIGGPLIVNFLAVAGMGLADTVMSGRLGADALAAVSVGHNTWMLAVTIGLENFASGMGTAAFVAYLSSLCNVSYTATQYALLTSFMSVARTWLSTSGGWLAERYDWVTFFVITTVAALPGLLLLVRLGRLRGSYGVAASVSPSSLRKSVTK